MNCVVSTSNPALSDVDAVDQSFWISLLFSTRTVFLKFNSQWKDTCLSFAVLIFTVDVSLKRFSLKLY